MLKANCSVLLEMLMRGGEKYRYYTSSFKTEQDNKTGIVYKGRERLFRGVNSSHRGKKLEFWSGQRSYIV